MLGSADPGSDAPGTFRCYAVCGDPDTASRAPSEHGAAVIAELSDKDYGWHEFSVRDPEGNRSSFGTYRGHPR